METQKTDWQGVFFGVALGVLAAYQYFKMPPVLPILARQYGYGKALSGGFMSMYSVSGLVFSVAVGRIFARHGPRLLLVAGFTTLAAGNLLGVLFPASSALLLTSRFLEGVGFSVVAVVGGVWTVLSATPEQRPIATALWTTWMPAGQVLASVVALPVTRAGGWSALWWLSLLLIGATALWGYSLLRGERADRGRTAPARAAGPGPSTALPLWLGGSLFCLWSTQYIGYMTWLPTYLVESFGLTPGNATLVYLLPPVLVIVFNLAAGMLLRSGAPLIPTMICALVVQTLSWLLVPLASGWVAGLASLLVYGVAAGIIPTCLFALPAALERSGYNPASGFSALMTGRNLGALVGPVLLGQAIAVLGSWNQAALLFAVVTAAAVLPAVFLKRHTRPAVLR